MNAGLNPNLAYGHGTLANTSAQMPSTSMPSVQKADTPQFDVLGAVTAAQDMKLKEAQSNILGQQALTEVATRSNSTLPLYRFFELAHLYLWYLYLL